MADLIGVDRKWFQHSGIAREHFDICKSKRTIAVLNGAIEVTSKELVRIIQRKRE